MAPTLDFPSLVRLIDERAVAFRAAVASTTSLGTHVLTCPEWTQLDLVRHLGEVHRFWARAVAAGPAGDPPDDRATVGTSAAPTEREALLAWSAESCERLLAALREAGPDRGCWTWWAGTQSPQTSAAVARHQLQEISVHTYDALITAGTPHSLSDEIALDGVDEFLCTCCSGTAPWPHRPAAIDVHALEGASWRLTLAGDGTRTTMLPSPGAPGAATSGEEQVGADASLWGTAGDLVLVLYGRIPLDSLTITGDRSHVDLLQAWDPDA